MIKISTSNVLANINSISYMNSPVCSEAVCGVQESNDVSVLAEFLKIQKL